MSHYRRLFAMTGLHFVAMYVLMYAMVNVIGNVHNNLNQIYMAGLMTASMVLLELPMMRNMYPTRNLNVLIMTVGAAALIAFFLLIRQQVAIFQSSIPEIHDSASGESDPDV